MERSRLTTFFLGIIAMFVIGVILYQLRVVLLPFVIALLLSNIFSPILNWLKDRGVPSFISLFVVLLSFGLVLFLLSALVVASTESFISELPKYEQKLSSTIYETSDRLREFLLEVNLVPDDFAWTEVFSFTDLTGALSRSVSGVFNIVSYLVLILLFMLFMLYENGQLSKRVHRAFPPDEAKRIATIIGNISGQVQQYLLTKTLISMGTGILTAVVCRFLGVDFALMWGFLAFLLNYIPNIGSIAAALFPFVLSILQFDTWAVPLMVIILLGVTQTIMGNIVEPRIMAFSLNLSTLVVLLSLIFWGWLWGIWGMILAVPLTATLKIIFENVDSLRPISILMSGTRIVEPKT